jgi:hypothetical protein|tara:strand:+ start:432 stop:2282 length:1851 start_codon:yes stop_codon:yes gene_type:complete
MDILTDYLNHHRHSHILTIFDNGMQTNFYLRQVARVEVYCISHQPEKVESINQNWFSKSVHKDFPVVVEGGYFFPGCDVMDHDIGRLEAKTSSGLDDISFRDRVGAINTLGYMKESTRQMQFVSVFRDGGGLYTKENDYRVKFFHRLHTFHASEWIKLLVTFASIRRLTFETFRIIHICHEEGRFDFPFCFAELYLEEEGYLCVDEQWCRYGFIKKYLESKFQYIDKDGSWLIYQKCNENLAHCLRNNPHDRYLTSSPFVLWSKMLHFVHASESNQMKWTIPPSVMNDAHNFSKMLGLTSHTRESDIVLQKTVESYYCVSEEFDGFLSFLEWTKKTAKTHHVICTTLYQSEEYLDAYFRNLDRLTEWITAKGCTWTIVFCYSESPDATFSMMEKYCATRKNFVYMESPRLAKYRSVDIAVGRNQQMRLLHEYFHDITDYMIVMDANYINFEELCTDTLDHAMSLRHEWDAISFQRQEYYDIWALSYDPYYLSCWSFEYECIDTMKKDLVHRLQKLGKNELMDCVSAFCGFALYAYPKFRNCWYSGYFELERFYRYNIEQNINLLQQKGIRFRLTNPECIVNYSEVTNDCEHKYFHLDAIEKHGARIRISPNYLFRA